MPAGGVVYITVNKDGAEDFKAYENTSVFADDIKTSYWYEDRYRGLEGSRQNYADYAAGLSGSYSHFDRKSWTMYLGMGSATGIDGAYEGQAHASSSVIVRDLPMKFTVALSTEGNVRMLNKNSTLGFRVDFFDEESGTYVKIDAQGNKTAITAEQFQTENQTIEQQYPADSSIEWIPLVS